MSCVFFSLLLFAYFSKSYRVFVLYRFLRCGGGRGTKSNETSFCRDDAIVRHNRRVESFPERKFYGRTPDRCSPRPICRPSFLGRWCRFQNVSRTPVGHRFPFLALTSRRKTISDLPKIFRKSCQSYAVYTRFTRFRLSSDGHVFV